SSVALTDFGNPARDGASRGAATPSPVPDTAGHESPQTAANLLSRRLPGAESRGQVVRELVGTFSLRAAGARAFVGSGEAPRRLGDAELRQRLHELALCRPD